MNDAVLLNAAWNLVERFESLGQRVDGIGLTRLVRRDLPGVHEILGMNGTPLSPLEVRQIIESRLLHLLHAQVNLRITRSLIVAESTDGNRLPIEQPMADHGRMVWDLMTLAEHLADRGILPARRVA